MNWSYERGWIFEWFFFFFFTVLTGVFINYRQFIGIHATGILDKVSLSGLVGAEIQFCFSHLFFGPQLRSAYVCSTSTYYNIKCPTFRIFETVYIQHQILSLFKQAYIWCLSGASLLSFSFSFYLFSFS
jgi:hypothetical protein